MAAAADGARANSLRDVAAAVAQSSSDKETQRLRGAIAECGMQVYLKMLLKDNFIHAGGWLCGAVGQSCVCCGRGGGV